MKLFQKKGRNYGFALANVIVAIAFFIVIAIVDHFSFKATLLSTDGNVWKTNFTLMLLVALVCCVAAFLSAVFGRNYREPNDRYNPSFSEEFFEGFWGFLTIAYLLAIPATLFYLVTASTSSWTDTLVNLLGVLLVDLVFFFGSAFALVRSLDEAVRKRGK